MKGKKAMACLMAAFMLVSTLPTTNLRAQMAAVQAEQTSDEPKQFMDCFEPIPLVGDLSDDCWGADAVGARDQQNGLEDREMAKYSYWDGAIMKDEESGKYYMFASRWNQAGGHWGQDGISGWQGSQAVYAVSDHLYGPYEDMGPLWPDWCEGAGHNVFPFELSDKDPLYAEGYRYAISISDTGMHGDIANGTLHISKSLDGPWELLENGNGGKLNASGGEGFNLSNISITVRQDGTYEATNRNGDIAIADSLAGVWEVKENGLWWKIPGMSSENIEDPVIWYSDGLYHIIVNKWDARMAYYLTSEDGITNWKRHPGMAYAPDTDFLRYEDGTVNDWTKLERPNVYVEDGKVKAMTFAVIDVQKEEDFGNDAHGSKIIVVPLSSEKLQNLDSQPDPLDKREGILPVADATIQSWEGESDKNYGKEQFLQLQKSPDFEETGNGLLGEGEKPYSSYDNKIAYVKYDLSDMDVQSGTEIDSAYLSLVYTNKAAGSAERDDIQIVLADSSWEEGSGKEDENGNQADEGVITWEDQPALLYESDETENTTAVSEWFHTADMNKVMNIDITRLVRNFVEEYPGETNISFALNETGAGNRIQIGSRESGEKYAPRLIVNVKEYGKAVTGISLDKEELALEARDSEKVTAQITPADAENTDILWTSQDERIATVNHDGVVTARRAGTTTITAKTEDGNYVAVCTVTVTDQLQMELLPKEDTNSQTYGDEVWKNYGAETYIQMQKDPDYQSYGMGMLGEGERPGEWYDNKIGYLKYDLSSCDWSKELEEAYLSLTYMEQAAGTSGKDAIQAVLCNSQWTEGSGNESENGNWAEEGALTWDNQPALSYDINDMENTSAVSETFSTSDTGAEVRVDVTNLIKHFQAETLDKTEVSFALNETRSGNRLRFGSKEAGEEYAAKLVLRFKPSEEVQETLSTAVLEYALQLAAKADTTGVNADVVEKFQQAVANGEAVLALAQRGDETVTQSMIDESWKEIILAMQYFSFKNADKTDLEKVIAAAETGQIALEQPYYRCEEYFGRYSRGDDVQKSRTKAAGWAGWAGCEI